jgi:hypothetical protein
VHSLESSSGKIRANHIYGHNVYKGSIKSYPSFPLSDFHLFSILFKINCIKAMFRISSNFSCVHLLILGIAFYIVKSGVHAGVN